MTNKKCWVIIDERDMYARPVVEVHVSKTRAEERAEELADQEGRQIVNVLGLRNPPGSPWYYVEEYDLVD